MKKFMFLAVMSAFMFACSDKDDPASANENAESNVTFEIAAVNNMQDGVNSRAPLYSQEATQHVTRVLVHAFVNNGTDYVFSKTFTISGWSDGTTFKRYSVASADNLPAGDYKFLAIGRDASDMFTVTSPAANQSFGSMTASIQNSGDESEIFAGWSQATVTSNGGARVSIAMTRKVAGVLGYFVNVPTEVNGTPVKYLRLTVSDANQSVNLTSGAAISSPVASYDIINMDLSGQTVNGLVYSGNDLSSQGVVKLANSQLSGSFFMPVSSATMTLGLYDTSNNALRSWTVKDTDDNTSFNILANHFYSLGIKKQAGNTNGGTGSDPSDDDAPIDLFTDQSIVITISPAWEMIHNLVIQ